MKVFVLMALIMTLFDCRVLCLDSVTCPLIQMLSIIKYLDTY